MLSKILDGIFQLVLGVIRIGIRLLIFQFLPAIFTVCVWLTEQSLLLMPTQAAKVRPGLVVIIAMVIWTMIGSGLWLIVAGWWLGLATLQWAALVSSLWGLAVGGTLARDWSPPSILQPPYIPDQTMGVHRDMTVGDPEDQTISVDQLFRDGLFVGPDVRYTGPRDEE